MVAPRLAIALGLLLIAPAAAQVPEQIHVSLGATVADEEASPPDVSHLIVQWTSIDPLMPGQPSEVRWRIDNGTEEVAPSQVIGVVRDQTISELEAQVQYGARLRPVPFGANITYEVVHGTGSSGERTVTMPHIAADESRIAVFSTLGYSGYDRENRERIDGADAPVEDVVAMVQEHDPDAVLLPGNIAGSTSLRPWDITMRMLDPLTSTVPTMVAAGPADNPPGNFHNLRERWVIPGRDLGRAESQPGAAGADEDVAALDDEELLYYGFTVGHAYVVVLNAPGLCVDDVPVYNQPATYPCSQGAPDMAQLEWLHDVLEDAREDYRPDWLVVALGSSPYIFSDDGSDLLARELFVPLLEEFNVDLVVGGGEGVYQRTYPLFNGVMQTTSTADLPIGLGPTYVVTSGGGGYISDPIEAPAPPWLAVHQGAFHATFLDISADRLQVQAIAADENRTVLDTFTIHKPSSDGYADALAAAGAGADRLPRAESEDSPAMFGVILLLGAVLVQRRRV